MVETSTVVNAVTESGVARCPPGRPAISSGKVLEITFNDELPHRFRRGFYDDCQLFAAVPPRLHEVLNQRLGGAATSDAERNGCGNGNGA